MRKTKPHVRSGLMATTTLGLLGSLAYSLGAATLLTGTMLAPSAALAQDYTSGALVGTVTANGTAVAGAKVTITSKKLGQSHSVTTNAKGSFSSIGLQPGTYDITVSASGYADYKATADVIISQEVRIDAALSSTGATQTVVVKGHRVRQDFTKTTSGLTVDLETLTAQEPIARNLTAVTMLAPTVTQGNPGFGNLASFGGASVAENAYYIDGLNITNPDTYLGSAAVPFDFYKTVEVKTGGFPAEYGRATGGVINATTKSGTNDFYFAVHGNYAPSNLEAAQADTYAYRGKFSTSSDKSLSVEMGGALIKDHLFAYGLYQTNDQESTSAGIYTGTYTLTKNTHPFLGGKLDYYVTPTQHLSLTYFDTTHTNRSYLYKYTDSTETIGSQNGYSQTQLGGRNWVLNYSGKVTDWFSISAAIGDAQDQDNVVPTDTSSYYVLDYTSGTATRISQQTSSNYTTDATERKFWRTDGDMRFDFWGHHHVRFGFDDEKNTMDKTTELTGGEPVQYRWRTVSGVKYLQIVYENLGGHVSSENYAGYLQDSWDITPTLNLQIGVRDDTFDQYNLSGERYMHETGNLAPRLGFSWDPTGEGKWKVFGSVGSNYIPPAMNLGYRGKDLYYAEYFAAPTGGWVIDSTTGLPASVGSAVSLSSSYTSACPTSNLNKAAGFSSSTNYAGTNTCVVYGNGTQEGATSKTSVGLKATRQDEVQLGVDYKVNDLWSVGVTAMYRTTKNVSEDSDFNDAIISYLSAHGLDYSQWVGGSSYYVWNVGDHDVTIKLKNVLPGETTARTITLTADELGHYQNAKREYEALVFNFKRAFDGKWGLQGSYTWSRLWGNYNGTVTEAGNGVQTDAGATYAWDSPGMETYGSGLLGNDRTHTLKIFGSYALTPDLLIGANLLIQSPEKFSCLGINPVDDYSAGYGDVSHYCGGVAAPLDHGPKGDWTRNIDLALRYTVPSKYAIGGKLVLRADVFNVFDTHSVTTRYVTYDYGTSIGQVDSNYGKATAYNTPRYMRLGFDLTY